MGNVCHWGVFHPNGCLMKYFFAPYPAILFDANENLNLDALINNIKTTFKLVP